MSSSISSIGNNNNNIPISDQTPSALHQAIQNNAPLEQIAALITAESLHAIVGGHTPLYLATGKGNIELVRILLEKGASFLKDDSFHRAVFDGSLAIMQLFIDKDKAIVNVKDKTGNPPLNIALSNAQKIPVLSLLLNNGAKVDAISDGKGVQAIHVAALHGDVECIEFLIQHGANVNVKNKALATPLFLACGTGQLSAVKCLLQNSAKVDEKNWTPDCTAMYFACHKGYHEIVKLLLEHGADVNAKAKDLTTPLYHACAAGNLPIVETLLHHHAKTNEKCTDLGFTALLVAIGKGHDEIVKLLLQEGADANVKPDQSGRTPLHEAARAGHDKIAALLIERGANVNAVDKSNDSPIIFATSNGHKAVVQLLLDQGTLLTSSLKIRCCYLAIAQGHRDIVELFLNLGLDVDATCNNESFLYTACAHGRKEIAQLLLTKKPLIDTLHSAEKQSALHVATSKNFSEIVELLINHGATVDLKNKDGQTPFYMACIKGDEAIAQLLLTKGAKIDAKNGPHDETALHTTSYQGLQQCVKFLIDNGANLNALDKYNLTPLAKACLNKQLVVAELLLDRGANSEEKLGSENRTVLHLAVESDADNIVALLIKKGADVNAKSTFLVTPLHLSCVVGKTAITQLLLASPQIKIDEPNAIEQTALWLALTLSHIETAKILLEHGASTNASISYDALYLACEGNLEPIVQLLLERKDVNVDEALHVAASNGYDRIVEMLINKGAKTDAKAPFPGETPLYSACLNGRKTTVELLLKSGAKIEERENRGRTAIYGAAEEGHRAIVELLLNRGANVNAKAEKGETPLHCSSHHGKVEVTQLLLDRGAHIDEKQDCNGKPALYIATEMNQLAIVQLLIERGATVSNVIATNTGIPMLYFACSHGMSDLAKRLLAENIPLNEKYGPQAETYLHAAARGGDVDIVNLLIEKGANPMIENSVHQLPMQVCKNELVFSCFVTQQEKAIEQSLKLLNQEFSEDVLLQTLMCLTTQKLILDSPFSNMDNVENCADIVTQKTHDYYSLIYSEKLFTYLNQYNISLVNFLAKFSKTEETDVKTKMGNHINRVKIFWELLTMVKTLYETQGDSIHSYFVAQFANKIDASIVKLQTHIRECETKMKPTAELKPMTKEEEFDEDDVFFHLPKLELAFAKGPKEDHKVNELTPEEHFFEVLGCEPNRLYEMRLRTGADLRRIGVDFTLRFLCDQLETSPIDANIYKSILSEIKIKKNTLQLLNIPDEFANDADQSNKAADALSNALSSCKPENLMSYIKQIKEFHKNICILLLKIYLNGPQSQAVQEMLIDEKSEGISEDNGKRKFSFEELYGLTEEPATKKQKTEE